jgi:RNA polymerase sigma-70 factor (ECF subfamily)
MAELRSDGVDAVESPAFDSKPERFEPRSTRPIRVFSGVRRFGATAYAIRERIHVAVFSPTSILTVRVLREKKESGRSATVVESRRETLPRVQTSRAIARVPDAGPDLSQLLASIAAGNEAALSLLYDATSAQVFGLARRIIGDEDVAEEATLDVYHQVWRKASTYSADQGSAIAWILTIARNRAIDHFRSGRRRRKLEASFRELSDAATARASDPSALTESDERRSCVLVALDRLPERQRRPVELAFFEGLSHSEIAERLGAPLGTVKTQIRLAMQKLRDSLRPLGESR